MDKPELKTADEAMEYAARLIEEFSLLDTRGVMAKKKRDREDAQLRFDTSKEVRKRCAELIRAFINRPDLAPRAILQRIADAEDEDEEATFLLTDAWPLAWKGLCCIEARIVCNSNSIPPKISYRLTLTDKGKAVLNN